MIKEHYSSAIPTLFNAIAITFGNHVFYEMSEDKITERLRRHEEIHVKQYKHLGVPLFLILYLFEYFRNRLNGFTQEEAYRSISYEVEAVKAEGVTDGTD